MSLSGGTIHIIIKGRVGIEHNLLLALRQTGIGTGSTKGAP
jgi:hypothetical protein